MEASLDYMNIEIYILPLEDAPEKMQDIPNLANASEYKYSVYRNDTKMYNSEDAYMCVTIQRSLDNYEIRLNYYDNGHLSIYGPFPQQLNDDGKATFPSTQNYYTQLETSLTISQNEYDNAIAKQEAQKKAQKELRESPPKIGMTTDQVTQSAWGYPNKKNIDTYSWGTTEQWVYSKGYVYFENGIVTSISTSER